MDPVVKTQMMIRKPVEEVFASFLDPTITSKFWFSRGSAVLAPGADVTWHWDMYGVSANVKVIEIEENRRIEIAWPNRVEWQFEEKSAGCLVTIVVSGFEGTEDEKLAQALDNMGGFSFLLAGCKAYLEHNIELSLVRDHNPDFWVQKQT